MKSLFSRSLMVLSLSAGTQAFGLSLTHTSQYAYTPQEQEADKIPYLTPHELKIPKFNDPSCFVNRVEIVFEGAVLHRVAVDNAQGTVIPSVTVSRSDTFMNLTGPTIGTSGQVVDPAFSHTFNNLGADEGELFPNYTGPDSDTALIPHFSLAPLVISLTTQAEIAAFIGSGDVVFMLQGAGSNSDTGPGNIDFRWRTYGGGKLSVTYGYTCPDQIGSGLALLTGVALLGLRRVKRAA